MDKRKFALRSDFIVIFVLAVIAIAAFAVFNSGEEAGYAEIIHDNELIARLSLEEDRIYTPEGFDVTFEIKDGAAAFISSDCPDKICVNMGFISKKGQSAVCLPNRLTLRITGGSDEADIYIG